MLIEKNKKSCSKINLINSSNIREYYKFISPSYGDSVIFRESDEGKEIIVSPFNDNENEGVQLNITIINKFGIVDRKIVSAQKNVLIDENYNLIYIENGKQKKIKL